MQKCDIFYLKLPSFILWDLEQLGRNFALSTRTIQGMCTEDMIGISVTMRMLEPTQRFEHRNWLQQWLQTYKNHIHVHIGPTCSVGLNNTCINTLKCFGIYPLGMFSHEHTTRLET